MSRFIDLLRHGTPAGGARYRGQIDDPLSEAGWRQMRASIPDPVPWTTLVSSPLSRCRAFAEALKQELGLPMRVDEGLREVGFGEWEGHTSDQIRQRWPGAMEAFYHDPIAARPNGAEDLTAFRQRVVAAFDRVVSDQADQPAAHSLLVAHAGVIRAIVSHVLDMPVGSMYKLNIANASIARIRLNDERPPTLMYLDQGQV